jgi:uncharacterized protein YbaP (TraB family)
VAGLLPRPATTAGRRRAGALVLAVALAAGGGGCGARASSCPPVKAGASDPRPFLWEVEGKKGSVVLFGTFHAGGRGDVPALALTRLRGARVFVAEQPPIDAAKVEKLLMLPRGQSLPSLIGDDPWYDLRDALAGSISDEELRRARPWYAMSLLASAMTDTPAPSMDGALADEARSAGARLEYLETGEEQLAALGDSVTADDLKQAIADRKQMRCGVSELTAAYRRGDGEAIRSELGEEAAGTLLDERNARWMTKLEAYLDGDGAFVAVGVSHLIGPGGLPALLEARGHRVTRLASPAGL